MPKNKRKFPSVETLEGAGVRVKRLFPTQHLRNYDPFVLLDEFFVDPSTGFPPHTHRGFEAITYMLKGSFRHTDDIGNDTEVFPGGVQRFTAGRGITHSEMPGKEKMNHGFQLWINLPKRLKGIEPSYQQVDPEQIPEITVEGRKIRTVVGEGSSVKLLTPVIYLDVTLDEKARYAVNTPDEFVGFIYVFQGVLKTEETAIKTGEALFLKEGERLTVQSEALSRFLVLTGEPHGEPIHQHGPFVD